MRPSVVSEGFGVREPSGAFEIGASTKSGSGLPHSKAQGRIFTWPFFVNFQRIAEEIKERCGARAFHRLRRNMPKETVFH